MREGWLTLPVFTALYVAAGMLGRATSLDNQSLSLVWPATGIAVLWYLSLVRRSEVTLSVVLFIAATIAISLATRSSSAFGVVAAAAHLSQVAAVVLLVRRWCPELGIRGGRPPLETPAALLRFMGAIAVGSAVGVGIGSVGLLLAGASFEPLSVVAWWGRNVLSVLALGTTGLLLIHRLVGRSHPTGSPVSRARALEMAALVAAPAGLVGLDYLSALPFTLLLPATTVWTALRFAPLVVSSQAILSGAAVVWLSLTDRGMFVGIGSQSTQVVLAQGFAGMTIMIGLLLAASHQKSLRLQAELERRQQDMTTFARRAAHELQSPIMLIDGWVELLSAQLVVSDPGTDGEPSRELDMVRRIRAATQQMRGLVGDMLADATAADQEVTRSRVDLATIAHDLVESLEVPGLVHIDPIPPVAGDAAMLRRLLQNLIGNSLKYVAPGQAASVRLSAELRRDGIVTVRVADRGIGIPAGLHQSVFEEFTRAHAEDYPGTGLGLGICRRIVERHGGEIGAYERQPGPGTVVEFCLPAWEADHTIHRDEPLTAALVSPGRAGN